MFKESPARNKRKRYTRIDFTHRTYADKGEGPRGCAGNTHMRTLNNTEWGGGGGVIISCRCHLLLLNSDIIITISQTFREQTVPITRNP